MQVFETMYQEYLKKLEDLEKRCVNHASAYVRYALEQASLEQDYLLGALTYMCRAGFIDNEQFRTLNEQVFDAYGSFCLKMKEVAI